MESEKNKSKNNLIVKFSEHWIVIPKLLYLTFSFFFYTLHAHRTQFVVQQYGVKKNVFSLYMAIPQFSSFVFGVFIASFNDRLGLQKYILLGVFVISTLLFMSFFYITNFILFLFIYTVYYCALSITLPLLDKIVLEYLDKTPGVSTSKYGTQRVFTPIGYMSLSFLLDFLVTNKKLASGGIAYEFDKLFWYGIVAGGIAFIATLLFVKNLPKKKTSSNLKLVWLLFRNEEFMFFILLIFLNGITRASMTNYLNVYFDDHYGFNRDDRNANNLNWWQYLHNTRKKSFCTITSGLIQLVFYVLSPNIIKKCGLLLPIFISQGFQLIRFLGYCILPAGHKYAFEFALILELNKGINFGLIQCSAVNLANKLCPPSLKSVSQIVYNGAFIAVATAISGFVCTGLLSTETSVGKIVPAGPYKLMFFTNLLITVLVIILMC